jgi:hypothetical protein
MRVSRRSLIKNLVENWGMSSIKLDLDYGELLLQLEDLGFSVVQFSEPRKFSINLYPLKRVEGFSGKLSAYDAGSVILERKNHA